jgi:hypothetical protein
MFATDQRRSKPNLLATGEPSIEIKGRLRHAHFAADLRHGRAGFSRRAKAICWSVKRVFFIGQLSVASGV